MVKVTGIEDHASAERPAWPQAPHPRPPTRRHAESVFLMDCSCELIGVGSMAKRKTRNMMVVCVAVVSVAITTSASAALIAGVDFEITPGAAGNSGNFDRTPDDLDAGDGISVSTDWTASNLAWDNNAQAGLIAPSTIAARSQNQNSWSITIPDTVELDLAGISFLARGATGSTGSPTGRDALFNTSLDGGPGGTMLWSDLDIIGRPAWVPVSIDLSGPTYQDLTDTTVTFYWYAPAGGVDLDTIEVSGTATVIPEPATMGLLAIGGLLGLRRRRRLA